MADQSWMKSPEVKKSGGGASGTEARAAVDETADRTAMISAKLKAIYRKAVLPVEKRYRYDYFFESPFLTDVEFDGELLNVEC
jgi:hypothetical protein